MRKRDTTKKRPSSKKTEYICYVGDIVEHKGRNVYVQQVLNKGNEKKRKKSFIKCCFIDDSGLPLQRTNVFVGQEWKHVNSEG